MVIAAVAEAVRRAGEDGHVVLKNGRTLGIRVRCTRSGLTVPPNEIPMIGAQVDAIAVIVFTHLDAIGIVRTLVLQPEGMPCFMRHNISQTVTGVALCKHVGHVGDRIGKRTDVAEPAATCRSTNPSD